MTKSPKVNSEGERALEKAKEQIDAFDNQVKELTTDALNKAPRLELEPQTKLAQSEIEKSTDLYLKPTKAIGSPEKFNEVYRNDYNFAKEYVHFIAENKEIIGEQIEMWTKPFAGMPLEFWKIPTNKPIWGPRYVAEQIKRASYHVLKMDESRTVGQTGAGVMYGQIVAESTVQRLDAIPVSSRKSVFMGAGF